MRKLIATIGAALALAGVGFATHAATSDSPAYASPGFVHVLPYIEQDNVYKANVMAMDV